MASEFGVQTESLSVVAAFVFMSPTIPTIHNLDKRSVFLIKFSALWSIAKKMNK